MRRNCHSARQNEQMRERCPPSPNCLSTPGPAFGCRTDSLSACNRPTAYRNASARTRHTVGERREPEIHSCLWYLELPFHSKSHSTMRCDRLRVWTGACEHTRPGALAPAAQLQPEIRENWPPVPVIPEDR